MGIKIVEEKISLDEVKQLARESFGEMLKAVVDLSKKKIAFGGEFHVDAEMSLIEDGSEQKNLWGINIYPYREKKEWVEYISLINIRPREGNYGMQVEDQAICEKILLILEKMIVS